MHTIWIVLITFFGYLIAYHTYGKWLSRKVFNLSPDAVVPSREFSDGVDYVPTPRSVVFGHHFTSIAGTGPIVGSAIAVFWGWLPALVWILVGSIFIGAVHDFGSLVVSLRGKGQTLGDITGRMINKRTRVLFLFVLFFALMLVIGIFGLVIALIFAFYPISVFAVWIELPVAVAIGFLLYKTKRDMLVPSIVALVLLYAGIYAGTYYIPVDLSKLLGIKLFSTGLDNVVVVWTVILLIYCFIASVLPVWTLLQPRDYINSHELFVALSLLLLGIILANPVIVAPAINMDAPGDAPPIFPFLFITIACGAVSGFHCLVSSGTSSKQLKKETDAQLVGYGSMLLEGGLAVIVIIACTAGLGMGLYKFSGGTALPVLNPAGLHLTGIEAWHSFYGGSWLKMTLVRKVGAFIEGGANILHVLKIPIMLGVGIMSVLVASFAATTLDTATRLQRYVIQELGGSLNINAITNKYTATFIAVITGGILALLPGPKGPGSGGLILWPLFGATNQMLAGLAFLVIVFYLLRTNKPFIFALVPMVVMVILPGYAMFVNVFHWFSKGQWLLFTFGVLLEFLQIWMVVEGLLLWNRVKGAGLAVDDLNVHSIAGGRSC